MHRALGEYLVAGIRTTVPFFTWLFAQPEFVEGKFHTTYLDELLKARNGRPFVEATPEVEEIAAIGAALQATLAPATFVAGWPVASAERRWKTQARAEGLRSGAGRARAAVAARSIARQPEPGWGPARTG